VYDFYVLLNGNQQHVLKAYAPCADIGYLSDYLKNLEKEVIKAWKPKQ
jgi:hypothetical protein